MNKLSEIFCTLIWPSYMKSGNEHNFRVVVKSFVLQKILRINAHVPWPVHPTSKVLHPHKIGRGSRTPGLGVGCHIDGRNGIVLGENVWIGPFVSLISQNHDVNDFHVYTDASPIKIGKNSWLAAHSIVLAGVELGEHTVVAAGAVVTKSFPQGNVILAGNPAKIVKELPPYGTKSAES